MRCISGPYIGQRVSMMDYSSFENPVQKTGRIVEVLKLPPHVGESYDVRVEWDSPVYRTWHAWEEFLMQGHGQTIDEVR